RHLPVEMRAVWDATLAAHGPERLAEAVVCWRAAGFNPTNLKGQLDWMRRGVPRKHQLDDRSVYDAKEAADELAAERGSTNGYKTKADKNRERLEEVAEDIARIRERRARRDAARDRDQELLGDGSGGADAPGADADRGSVGGDSGSGPHAHAARLVH